MEQYNKPYIGIKNSDKKDILTDSDGMSNDLSWVDNPWEVD